MPIYKAKGGWKIENVSGIMKTLEEAKKRLAAIKAKQGRK